MAVQSLHNVSERGHLLAGVLLFVIVGVVDRARASKAKSGWGMIAARLPQPAVFEGWGNPDGVRYLQHCRTRVSDPHGQCSSPQLRDHSLQYLPRIHSQVRPAAKAAIFAGFRYG